MAVNGPAWAQRVPDIVEGEAAIQLDAYMVHWAETGEAGALLVAQRGKIILKRGYGQANRELNIPNTGETVFPIGSIVKPLTRAAINQLEAAGQIQRDDPISKFFDDVPADKQGITIAQLLGHQSGLRAYHGPDLVSITREETLRRIFDQQLRFEPGTDEAYSNSGYTVLAAIIEIVSGQAYTDYIGENVLPLAGMTRTGFYRDPRWSRDEVAVMYDGLQSFEAGNSPLDWPETTWALMGNGGIAGPPEDLYRWAQYQRENGATGPMFAAGGGDYGNVAVLVDLPDHGTIVFMTNTDDDGMEDPEMIEDLVSMGFGVEISLSGDDEAPDSEAKVVPLDALTDLPYGTHALAFLELVNTGSDDDLRRFIEERMDPGFQDMPFERHQVFIARIRDELSGEPAVLKQVVQVEPYMLELYVQTETSEQWYKIIMAFDEFEPYRMNGLMTEVVDGPPVHTQ